MEDYKKYLCELAGVEYYCCGEGDVEVCGVNPLEVNINNNKHCAICEYKTKTEITLEILIRAVFAINRDVTFNIQLDDQYILVSKVGTRKEAEFFYSDHHNHEQEALNEALKYVYNNSK